MEIGRPIHTHNVHIFIFLRKSIPKCNGIKRLTHTPAREEKIKNYETLGKMQSGIQ